MSGYEDLASENGSVSRQETINQGRGGARFTVAALQDVGANKPPIADTASDERFLCVLLRALAAWSC